MRQGQTADRTTRHLDNALVLSNDLDDGIFGIVYLPNLVLKLHS